MNTNRNVYLKMKTLDQARLILFNEFGGSGILRAEIVSTPDAVGRVLAKPVNAIISSPGFHSAAMDGIAVKAESTFGACEGNPKQLTIGKNAFFVNTGHMIPENCNAVIMIEHVNILDNNTVEIENPAFPWQHIRKIGEDIVATELIFTQNHEVTAYCVGALLSGGIFSVAVKKKPKILIIPTGSELVDWQTKSVGDIKPGQIPETNSFVLGKLIESCGGKWERNEIVKDDPEKIEKTVKQAVAGDFDLVLTIGGSSAGLEDYTKKVFSRLGKVLVHGVTIMPGKPLIIGNVAGKPVFGIPGYPVSAIIALEQFVRPLICKMLGQPDTQTESISVQPARKIVSKLGVEEFVRVKLGKVGTKIVAAPLPRAAGCITTLTQAHGIIRIPNHVEGIRADEPVKAELLRPVSSINNTIVIVGSHDNTLDVLADELRVRQSRVTISSSHVGSMGGLMAIRKGVCHIAGSHLLDTETGFYNTSYVKKYLKGIKIRLVNLVLRDQGIIVPRGNPKQIKGFKDLAREDISIINRQPGSGTRILFDYKLNKLKIDPGKIKGYENEEFTHMAVAVAVLSKTVDAGLGIHAAAKALNLDFIPVVTEQYDLVIPNRYFESENIRTLLEIINTDKFKNRVQLLGGYSTQKTGAVLENRDDRVGFF